MAKRKAGRATTRGTAARKKARQSSKQASRRASKQASKPASGRAGTRTRSASRGTRKAAAPKATARKATTRKSVKQAPARAKVRVSARKSTITRLSAARVKAGARKAVSIGRKAVSVVRSAGSAARKLVARAAPPAARAPRVAAPKTGAARKLPALFRDRRVVHEDDIVPTPPSSLDLDRSASAVRTGRRELHDKFVEHTETSPALTGGDIDADWESAYSVGDEAPGGDNPTPDQDIVDDIGRAVGVEYQDNEELKGETKISDRDKKRWELDPASAEDYNDR